MTAPVNSALPVITGTAGVGATLAVSNGAWSGTPTSFAYQWSRGSTPITDETESDYVVTLDDVGHTLKATVTATNVDGSTPADSAATLTVPSLEDPFLDPSQRPIIEAQLLSLQTAIDRALATGKVEYEIQTGAGGRRMKLSTLAELFEARDRLRNDLRAILAAQRGSAGLGNSRRVGIRFGRA
jgi:hypothetical protein